MDKLEPPQSFSFKGNVSQGWLKHFQFYLTATERDGKNDKVKTSVLLTCIKQRGREIYETFNFDNPGDEMRLASVLEQFSEYCNPRKNITILRHKLFTYPQNDRQNFHDFVTELKKLSSECEFETLHDSLMDMIVCGTNDNSLKEPLPCESELSFPKAISAGHAAKETHKHAHEIVKSNKPSISTRFQNTENLEVKLLLMLQR